MRHLAVVLAIVAIAMIRVDAAQAREGRPNIVFVLIDDLGYGDLSCHGNLVFQTPNLDKFHDQSIRFTDFCVSATCSPSRAALISGMHEFKSGVTHTEGGRERMALDAVTLPQLLKTAGYTTGIFGKWHLGAHGDYRPEHRGFDVSVTTVGDTQNSHVDPTLLHNGVPQPHKGFREDILFDLAIDFIKTQRDHPFYCYIPTYSPHAPLRAPAEYVTRVSKQFPKAKPAAFYAMVANVDDNIGRLMATLRELNLDDNTIVIVMNDNGATYGVDNWNASMRGCKGASWFGGYRALSLWRWPGHFQPRDEGRLTDHVDFLPTIADYAGAKIPGDLAGKLDGFTLRPLLESADAPWHDDRMIFQHVGRWPAGTAASHAESFCGVRWQNLLLVRATPCANPDCKGMCSGTVPWRTTPGYTKNFAFHYALSPDRDWALYDVKTDPGCERPLNETHPQIVTRLQAAYRQWWPTVLPFVQGADAKIKTNPDTRGGGE